MAELRNWDELPAGGTVVREASPQPETGGWRTGVKPAVDLSRCVNCLLCWLYCPDSAVVLDGTTFTGFHYRYCKGCEICAEMCPVDAITMVPEEASP
jgi:2-oxoacid:acceptor oxidoreductase delta subunit (pyruvate/2-ketoisovalerate family)